MTRARLLVVLFTGIILASGSLVGQNKDQPPPKGQLPSNWKKLGLTDEQVQMVYRVQAKYRSEIVKLQQKITELKKDEKGELDKVLTPAQKARLREILTGEKDKDKDKDKGKDKDKDKGKDKDK